MILNSQIGDGVAGDTAPETLDTPLHFVARNNVMELARLLLTKPSINVSTVNAIGQTPLHEAVANQHLEMVQLLAEAGAAIDVVDKYGRTPLHLTVPCSSVGLEITHELLKNNSESSIFDIADDFGQPLLHHATLHNCADYVVYYLLNHDANCSSLNGEGLSPMHLARKHGNEKLIQLMVHTEKCSLAQRDHCGKDVLSINHKQPRTCGQVPEIANAVVSVDSNCIGAKGVIECSTGYVIIGGSTVIQCGSNGTWQLGGGCTRAAGCEEISKAQPSATSGIYKVIPNGQEQPIDVFCDMETLGGGWTVIQRRVDSSQDFHLNWNNYKIGFGNMNNGSFWLGNDNIHRLTGPVLGNQRYSLLINMVQFSDSKFVFAYYDGFFIEDEGNNYKLRFNKFVCGNHTHTRDALGPHNGMPFSTHDRDNDPYSGNCAASNSGGWWFHSGCLHSNLNGQYRSDTSSSAICWGQQWYPMKHSVMMIRKEKLPSSC